MSSSERSATSSKQLGVFAEKVLSRIGAAVVFVVLQLTVANLVHALLQQVRSCPSPAAAIPFSTPDYLDHFPASAAKYTFQFLDNFAVTANRAVQSLQITVYDKSEVAQMFTAS